MDSLQSTDYVHEEMGGIVPLIRILSLSSVYPNVAQPTKGTFVRSRLARIASLANVKVVAPVALVEYGNPERAFGPLKVARLWQDGPVEVLHPSWFYPPFGGVVNSVFLCLRLWPLVNALRREFPFEVIDSHFAYPDGIAAAMLARLVGCPYVITLRGNETMHAQFLWRGRAIRWAIRRAKRIIAVSERLREFAIACGAHPLHVCTIPNGVDTAVFQPRGESGVRADLGLAPDTPFILSVGYLIERKGHHRVIQALQRLRQASTGAHLVIAGGPGAEGRYEPVLRTLAERLGLSDSVHFTGPVSPQHLAELMSAANLVCLASTREGWPNVVNEALACGSPVVAMDVGGVPDMITSDRYGFIVPVDNQGALENALARALACNWDRRAIAEWGMSRSWEQVAVEVLNVLREAVNDKRSTLSS